MMEVKSKVTVVIRTYNRKQLLKRAIESVFQQTMHDWKLLIVDDGSTDQTEEMLIGYTRDDRMVYHRQSENFGIGKTLNKALELVDTKYMVLLDDDDWLEDIALENLLRAMEKEPVSTALAYGNHRVWKEDGQSYLKKQRSFSKSEKHELLCWLSTFYPRFFRTSCLKEIGGWDISDQYGCRYMEDRRVMYKLIVKYDFLWINKPLYNLNRSLSQRLTSIDNQPIYVELKKELITRTLIEWGNQFRPEFSLSSQGWLKTKLIPWAE